MRILYLCLPTIFFYFSLLISVQAQTPNDLRELADTLPPPQRSFGNAIADICPQLANENDPGTKDLFNRCSDMVANATDDKGGVSDALLQVSTEKVATQGTNSVKVSNTNIGSRLAALRGGATGISIQGFVFNINGQEAPVFDKVKSTNSNSRYESGTQVASLVPLDFSLVSQTEPAEIKSPFEKLGIFVNGTLTFGDKDKTSREAGFDFHALGVTGGIDYRLTDYLVLGGAFSYVHTDVDLDSNGGNLDSNDYSFSIFSTFYLENFYIDGIGTIGWINFDQSRNIIYQIIDSPPINQTADSNFNAGQYSLSFDVGYEFNYKGLTFGPFGQFNYIKADIDGYKERISDDEPGFGLGLNVRSQKADSLTTVLGAQATYALSTGIGVFLPQILFGWEHEYKDDSRLINATFINDTTNTPILVPTDDPDRNFFDLGLGLSAQFPHGISGFVYYQTVLAYRDLNVHDFVVGLRINL